MIKLSNVSFSYTVTNVFRDLNLKIDDNITILGKSGCGKSTLLHLISGIIKPDFGQVMIDGADNSLFRNKIGLVMQKGGVFTYKTVYENIALGLLRSEDKEAKIKEVAKVLGISDHLNKYPSQLSGGQVQRAALGRVLCMKPKILLLDEPFSALDEITRQHLQSEILEITQNENMLMVTVTHSIEEAVKLGNSVVVLSSSGTIIEQYDVRKIVERDIHFYEKCIEIKQSIEDELI